MQTITHQTASEDVISQLEKSSKSIFEWFENSGLKGNPDKCHFCDKLRQTECNFETTINENKISNTIFEKLLRATFGNQLNFNYHICKICKTVSNKPFVCSNFLNRIFEINFQFRNKNDLSLTSLLFEFPQ